MGLCPDDVDDIWGTDRAETLISRIVADSGGGVVSMFSQAEEDVDARSNWIGWWKLWSESRGGLTSDGVLLFFQVEDNPGNVLKLLDRGVCGQDIVPDKEHEFRRGQNWTVLRRPVHLVYSQGQMH